MDVDDVRREARPVLLRLMMLSHAPAARMGSVRTGNGAHESSRPPGELHTAAERYRDSLSNSSLSVKEARAILTDARAELMRTMRRPMANGTTETLEEYTERIVNDGCGWPVDDVASALHCTPTFVRRVRLACGRDPETGNTPPDADPWELAQTLRMEGRSYRTIAALTGIPRSTLADRLS
jgi:hypothetical protein